MNKIVLLLLCSLSLSFATDAKDIYTQKCQNCHGENGQLSALGHSSAIGGWDSAKTLDALQGYKNGIRNSNGMGEYMKIEISSYSDEELTGLANYIATLKTK